MTREQKTGLAFGGIGGLIVWLFDFRHILIGGTPNTAITNVIEGIIPVKAICDIGLEGVGDICEMFATLLVFTVIGMIVGYVAVPIKQKMEKIIKK